MEQCQQCHSAGNWKSECECYTDQAMGVEKASYPLQICETRRRAVAQRNTAAFPGHVKVLSQVGE